MNKKLRTRMVFMTIEQRDVQLKALIPGSFQIDGNNPLVVHINFI